jgi:hypothetical protein
MMSKKSKRRAQVAEQQSEVDVEGEAPVRLKYLADMLGAETGVLRRLLGSDFQKWPTIPEWTVRAILARIPVLVAHIIALSNRWQGSTAEKVTDDDVAAFLPVLKEFAAFCELAHRARAALPEGVLNSVRDARAILERYVKEFPPLAMAGE